METHPPAHVRGKVRDAPPACPGAPRAAHATPPHGLEALAEDALVAAREALAMPSVGAARPGVLMIQPGHDIKTGGEVNMALLTVGLAAMGFPVATMGPRGPSHDFTVAHGVRDARAPAPGPPPPSPLPTAPARLAALAADCAALQGGVAAYEADPSQPDAVTLPLRALATAPEVIAAVAARDAAWPPSWGVRQTRVLAIAAALRATAATVCVSDLPDDAAASAMAIAGRADARLVWYVQNSEATPRDAWLARVSTPVAVHESVLAARVPLCAHARVARNGINLRRFVPRDDAADEEPPTLRIGHVGTLDVRKSEAPPTLRIGHIGTLDMRKNQLLLVRACAAAALPPFELWLVGEGSAQMRALLHAAAAAAGVSGEVRLLGHRADVPALLQQLDIFAFPSRSEGLSLAVTEAMASGVAVLASDLPSHRAIAGDHITLLPATDVDAWAAALHALAHDAPARRRRGLAGRAYVEAQELSQGRMLAQFAAALQQATARPADGA